MGKKHKNFNNKESFISFRQWSNNLYCYNKNNLFKLSSNYLNNNYNIFNSYLNMGVKKKHIFNNKKIPRFYISKPYVKQSFNKIIILIFLHDLYINFLLKNFNINKIFNLDFFSIKYKFNYKLLKNINKYSNFMKKYRGVLKNKYLYFSKNIRLYIKNLKKINNFNKLLNNKKRIINKVLYYNNKNLGKIKFLFFSILLNKIIIRKELLKNNVNYKNNIHRFKLNEFNLNSLINFLIKIKLKLNNKNRNTTIFSKLIHYKHLIIKRKIKKIKNLNKIRNIFKNYKFLLNNKLKFKNLINLGEKIIMIKIDYLKSKKNKKYNPTRDIKKEFFTTKLDIKKIKKIFMTKLKLKLRSKLKLSFNLKKNRNIFLKMHTKFVYIIKNLLNKIKIAKKRFYQKKYINYTFLIINKNNFNKFKLLFKNQKFLNKIVRNNNNKYRKKILKKTIKINKKYSFLTKNSWKLKKLKKKWIKNLTKYVYKSQLSLLNLNSIIPIIRRNNYLVFNLNFYENLVLGFLHNKLLKTKNNFKFNINRENINILIFRNENNLIKKFKLKSKNNIKYLTLKSVNKSFNNISIYGYINKNFYLKYLIDTLKLKKLNTKKILTNNNLFFIKTIKFMNNLKNNQVYMDFLKGKRQLNLNESSLYNVIYLFGNNINKKMLYIYNKYFISVLVKYWIIVHYLGKDKKIYFEISKKLLHNLLKICKQTFIYDILKLNNNYLSLILNNYYLKTNNTKTISNILSKIYNKKVEIKIIKLKHIWFDSKILNNYLIDAVALGNRNRRYAKIRKFIKHFIIKPYKDVDFFSSDSFQWNSYISNNLLNKDTIYKPLYLNNYVVNNIKYKKVKGIKLSIKGRITRRITAARSIYKYKLKGIFKDDFTFKPRNQTNISFDYSYGKSKVKIGSFGLKSLIKY